MKNRFQFLLVALVVALSLLVHAQDKDKDDDDDDQPHPSHPAVMKPTDKPAGVQFACPYEKDFRQPHKIGTYTLRILPVAVDKDDKDDKDQDADARCRAVLTSAGGKRTTIAYEWALTLDKVSGPDLTGDGTPGLVLEGYNGGLHCCYTYLIVRLGPKPQVLHTFANPFPMTFEKQPDGSTLIHAADGVFNYFMLPTPNGVIPQLALKMQGGKLVDVSAEHPEYYDRQIAQARSQLTPADLEKFRKSNYRDKLFTDQLPTVHNVLTIVLNYIYSGREEKAWQTLDEFWPPADVGRVKSLIAERRNRGLLANLECECHPAMIARQRKPPHKTAPDETTDPRIHAIIDDM